MSDTFYLYALAAVVTIIAAISIYMSPKAKTSGAFFSGLSPSGEKPGLWLLTFSQVTTWIFARSLMNAAILGFFYGLWGTIAYAAYYLSFLTGGKIIDNLRFEQGYDSVQAFLRDRFGRAGTWCYNFVVGVRLVSEVFANLLVIGVLFGAAGSNLYVIAVLVFATVILLYSMLGGLHASLRTDLFQMRIFMAVLTVLTIIMLVSGHFVPEQLLFKPFDISDPGPILLLVALLQVWSYPMHDPVMMDRGFLADRETTRKSFLHAGWISVICIMLFGILGVFAGANTISGEDMNATLTRLLGAGPMFMLSIALIVSAMSTLDSTLSSSAKLIAVDMKVIKPTMANGRLVMALFMVLGVGCVFLGNKDLFSAVAVSGTASMYLVPVVFFSLWGKRADIPVWSYVGSFMLALGGALLYFTESSGHTQILGESHKYTKLLWISLTLMMSCNLLFWVGAKTSSSALRTQAA